jgi:hypothetical protein
MTHPIPHDDLQPGMWVTIRDIHRDAAPPAFLEQQFAAWSRRSNQRAAIQPGRPMRVLAVDLPFLHLTPIDREGDEMGPYILDLREQPVVKCVDGIAQAYQMFGRRRRQGIRARAAREMREDAMEKVEIEIERHRRLVQAGIIPSTPVTKVPSPADEQAMLEAIAQGKGVEKDAEKKPSPNN